MKPDDGDDIERAALASGTAETCLLIEACAEPWTGRNAN